MAMKKSLIDIVGSDDYLVSVEGEVFKRTKAGLKKCSQHLGPTGYLYVRLTIDGKRKHFRVNKLVALAFLENPENKSDVQHLNTDKLDNYVDNLSWATRSENMLNEITAKRSSDHAKESVLKKRIPVVRVNPFKFYNSLMETTIDGYNSSHVKCCCNGVRKTHGNCQWRFATEVEVKKFGKKYTFMSDKKRTKTA